MLSLSFLKSAIRTFDDSAIMELNAKIPDGPLEKKWDNHRFNLKLVNPANKRKYHIIVVGTGLAGASAAASLAELGYNVTALCYHESPRRAHSISAQGGINAPKNYANDGDSIHRLFCDTVKEGDYRAREANVYWLAQVSNSIIDQCVAQGVPFARDYGGLLDTRSFGGAQVSRTFYARGQTGQQLLLGAYQALCRQIGTGAVKYLDRREMLDLVVIDGQARGIVARNLRSGELESYVGHAVILATGGYGNVFFLSTNAKMCNGSAIWRAHKHGALFGNPCFTQIHPTCIPVSSDHQSKLTLMSESLRNDGRIWVPKAKGDTRAPKDIPENERDYYLERIYPSFGNLVPRDVASRRTKEMCDNGCGVGPTKLAVYLDFKDTIKRHGRAHGPLKGVAACQLHMRSFNDGDTIVIEPWRAKAFPIIKDLVVDRSAFDRIIEAGGFVSVKTGGAPDANAIPIPKPIAEEAFEAAACIGCGACVAACKNASAMLFVAAKVSQLALLPQGQAERKERAEAMIAQMDKEGFGACSNTYACEAECPKQVSVSHIARLNRELLRAKVL
jgi:succinate dehydrogenase/fumarate reductase-like Fe-S protein